MAQANESGVHAVSVKSIRTGTRIVWVWYGRNYNRRGEVQHILANGKILVHFDDAPRYSWQMALPCNVQAES